MLLSAAVVVLPEEQSAVPQCSIKAIRGEAIRGVLIADDWESV
jgi:hypothetical protein